MKFTRAVVGLVSALLAASAAGSDDLQDHDKRVIKGLIIDGTSGQPVAGAAVRIGAMEITTGAEGTFNARVDKARPTGVVVDKTGYANDRLFPFTIQPNENAVVFRVFRAGTLSGRLVDSQTRKPVRGVSVNALRVEYKEGRRFPLALESAETDAAGRFALTGLLPGEYFVEAGPESNVTERVLRTFADRDVERVESGYPRFYWPGQIDYGTPVLVAAGGEVNCGDIAMVKAPAYRAHLKLTVAECSPKRKIWFQILQTQRAAGIYTGSTRATDEGPCPASFLVTGLQPGRYYLEAMSLVDRKPDGPFIETPLDVLNGNQNVELQIPHGVTLTGNVVVPANILRESWAKTSIGLSSIYGMNSGVIEAQVPDSEGKFSFRAVHEADWRIRITGIGRGLYVKSVLYNGIRLSGQVLRPNLNSMVQTLTIELADKAASIAGNIEEREACHNCIVGLVESEAPDVYSQTRYTQSSTDGAFVFEGLAPGEYRVFAIPAESRSRVDQPGVLEALIRDAAKVSISESQSAAIRVRLASP